MKQLLLFASLLALALAGCTSPAVQSLVLDDAEDAYVVADVATTDDPQGLRDKNFGNLDFIKIWYASQVQQQEQMVSIGLFKFDLAPLKDVEVKTAHLQLYALRADLAQPARLVDVSLAEGAWSEAEVTFNTVPQVGTPSLASAAVYGAGVWYSWDVTPSVVRKVRDGLVSYAAGLRTVENKREEQAVFASRKAGRNAPRLVVTYAPSVSPVPPYAWPAGIAGAAVLAFVVGLGLGRLRRED
ncbi:MAG: DNRLRE domain-containing protein [Chloroflexi bacterium]|nr:DNRLRE domain-containing protein [Chloroflexota bacterium]